MKILFGAAISLVGAAVLILLVARRRAVVASFGGGSPFVTVMVLALGSSATLVLPEGLRSPALVLVAACFFIAACLTCQLSDMPGGPHRHQRRAWWAYGALLTWCFFVDVFVGDGIYNTNRWFTYAAAFVVWSAIGMLASQSSLTAPSLAYTASIVLCVMTVTAAISDSSWTSCSSGRFNKCSPAGALYKSFAISENYIAIIASCAFVAALVSLRGALRVLVVAQGLIVVVASGSRTGMVALGIAVVVATAARLAERRRLDTARAPITLYSMAVGLVVGVGTYLVLHAQPGGLSRRGGIWVAVRRHVEDHPVSGVGVSKWTYYQDFGESPHHFFHSGFALALFAGGFVGVALFGAWLIFTLGSANRPGVFATVVSVTGLLSVYSITEVIWNPLAIDGLTWIVAVLSSLKGSSSQKDCLRKPVEHPCEARRTGSVQVRLREASRRA